MTKLHVAYRVALGHMTETVEVADDEEYWFENPGTPGCSLNVGRCLLHPGNMAKMTDADWQKLQGQPIPKPRLHIFNLCRVEVLP